MKQLTDTDIENMISTDKNNNLSVTNDKIVRETVRKELQIQKRIPKTTPIPNRPIIDFHGHTEEESWQMLINILKADAREITVITGASGILHQKFPQWVNNTVISNRIESCKALNNGSFLIKTHKKTI